MPAGRLFRLLGLATLALVFGLAAPVLVPVALAADGLLLAAFAVDLLRARRAPVRASRDWPPTLSQESVVSVRVTLHSTAAVPLTIRLREGLHPFLAPAPLRHALSLPPRGEHVWHYDLRPLTRGEAMVLPLTARILGPWGLAWSQRDLLPPTPRRVWPQVRWGGRVGQLLERAQRHQLGSMPMRWHGPGAEFYALRPYLHGDPLTRVHWKASARHGRLLSREETWERGARLVVLLDCARGMTSRVGTRDKLDHALAASLALARVASARGDHVTLIAFADRVERVVRIGPGGRQTTRAYAALYDLPARLAEPAYDVAVERALDLEPRSATTILITSVVDLTAAELLRASLVRLETRHRTLLVHLDDPELARLGRVEPADAAEAFAQVASLEIRLANERLARRLRGAGIRVVSTPADRLTLEALEAYLALYRVRLGRRAAV